MCIMDISRSKMYVITFLNIIIVLISKVSGDEIPESSFPCAIQGSSLKTGMWYTIEMLGFGTGYLTWSNERDSDLDTFWYVLYVYNIDRNNKSAVYGKGGELYETIQWEFIQSEKYPGWYKMRNRQFFDNYFVTWSKTEFVQLHKEKNISNYLILERGRDEEDYMMRPVQVEGYEDNRIYHQLKMKSFQDGFITWSRGRVKDTHLIQNDHRSESPQMAKYQKSEPWYNDTLFTFKQVDSSDQSCDYLRNSSFESGIPPNLHVYFCILMIYILKYFAQR